MRFLHACGAQGQGIKASGGMHSGGRAAATGALARPPHLVCAYPTVRLQLTLKQSSHQQSPHRPRVRAGVPCRWPSGLFLAHLRRPKSEAGFFSLHALHGPARPPCARGDVCPHAAHHATTVRPPAAASPAAGRGAGPRGVAAGGRPSAAAVAGQHPSASPSSQKIDTGTDCRARIILFAELGRQSDCLRYK